MGVANPFVTAGQWFKGNLHTHTTESDGACSPAENIRWHEQHGYDFVSITDHNRITDPAQFCDSRILTLLGTELSLGVTKGGGPSHLVACGLPADFQAPPPDSLTPQEGIDLVSSHGAASLVAHPHWSGMTMEELGELTGYAGIEVYNTGCDRENRTGLAEPYWDDLLRRGRPVWGEEMYFDATKVEANASLDSVLPRFAIESHLIQLFAGTDAPVPDQHGAERMSSSTPSPEPLPVLLPEVFRGELATTNAGRHDWIAEEGRQDRDAKHGDYQRISDFLVSKTDPDSSLMPRRNGTHPGYHVHYAVDGGKARIILQALVTLSASESIRRTPHAAMSAPSKRDARRAPTVAS